MKRSRILLGIAVLLAATAVPLADAAAPKITNKGVGRVKLGRTFRSLNRAHLIGHLRRGCELSGPNERIALLRAPLKGSVHLTRTRPLRVDQISITGGARARGVGIGSTLAAVKAAFPKAKVDHSTDRIFEITLVKVPRGGGGRLQFAVSTKTHKVDLIGVPDILFCE